MNGREQQYVAEAFETNWVTPLGPNVQGFEKDLEEYLGENVLVAALTSGTAALHLGLVLLGTGPGDEVICQSMTFSASANPIVYQGATPVFVDSEPDTWNLCPQALEEAIKDRLAKGKKPKAIIAVHLYGMPFKANEIRTVASRYDIPVLEDAAEALGSRYRNQRCGTLGDIAVLSFNGNKIITTSGGGALVTRMPELKKKAIFLATQAQDTAPHYQHSQIGYNYRLSNILAGIGRGQMEVLNSRIAMRRSMHDFYVQCFRGTESIRVFSEPEDALYSNYWLSCITTDSYQSREKLRLSLEKENIESRPLWKPMHLQPVFKDMPYYGGKTSENLFYTGLCLPSGSNLTDHDRDRIRNALLS